MTTRWVVIAAIAGAVVVTCVVLLVRPLLSGDFVVLNRTEAVLRDIDLIHYDTTYRRIDRLDPEQTIRIPHDGSEEGWSVAYSDSEGRWISPGCIYPMASRDENVVIQTGHHVNNDAARPMK